jgi:hypothetical protein
VGGRECPLDRLKNWRDHEQIANVIISEDQDFLRQPARVAWESTISNIGTNSYH